MGVDRQYVIRIASVADQSGVSAAAAGLDDFGKKGRHAGEEAGEGFKLFNFHGREAHKLIHTLDEIAPGAGLALRAAFSPQTVGIAGMLTLLHEVLGITKEWTKTLEEARGRNAETTVAVWEAQGKAMRDAGAAALAYADALNKSTINLDALKQKEELELEVLKKQIEMRVKLAGGDKLKAAEETRRGERSVIEKLTGMYSDALGQRWEAQATFEEAKRRAGAEATGIGADQSTMAQKWLEGHKDDVLNAQKAFDQARERAGGRTVAEMEENARIAGRMGGMGGLSASVSWLRQAAELDEATKRLAEAKERQETANAAIAAHEAATKALTAKADEASEAVAHYIKAYQDAEAALRKQTALTNQRQREEDAVELQSMGVKPGSVLGRTLLHDIEIEEARGRSVQSDRARLLAQGVPEYKVNAMERAGLLGEHLDAGQQLDIRQLRAALRSQGANNTQVNEIFKEMMDMNISHEKKMADLLKVLRQTKQQMNGTLNP